MYLQAYVVDVAEGRKAKCEQIRRDNKVDRNDALLCQNRHIRCSNRLGLGDAFYNLHYKFLLTYWHSGCLSNRHSHCLEGHFRLHCRFHRPLLYASGAPLL
jgi:hypothetical protein